MHFDGDDPAVDALQHGTAHRSQHGRSPSIRFRKEGRDRDLDGGADHTSKV
jgi:hypothetical protein